MSDITHGQRKALEFLHRRHIDYPMVQSFASIHVGVNYAALLRKLAQQGYVNVTKGGRGSRQFFAITDSGRAILQEES